MEIIKFSDKSNIPNESALCLGSFDGVHLGHRQLFDAASKKGTWGVMVFDGSFKNEKVLTSLSEKLEIIKELGADYVITAEPNKNFLNISGSDFYKVLIDLYGIETFVAGYDYRFGKGACYSAEDLAAWCETDGKKVHIEQEFLLNNTPVKSTHIRNLIELDKIKKANELLGYCYFLSGRVEKGLGNGRKMGFPTANVSYVENKLLPTDGVYKGRLIWCEKAYDALINIGKNPTFDAQKRTVEVHILEFDADLYGEAVKVEFLSKIRGEIPFDSTDELIEQIKRDISSAGKE